MSESITLNPCLAIEVLLQKHAAVGRINVARGVSLEGRGHRSVRLHRRARCLAISLRLLLTLRFTKLSLQAPQGRGPLPATGGAHSSAAHHHRILKISL